MHRQKGGLFATWTASFRWYQNRFAVPAGSTADPLIVSAFSIYPRSANRFDVDVDGQYLPQALFAVSNSDRANHQAEKKTMQQPHLVGPNLEEKAEPEHETRSQPHDESNTQKSP